MGIFNLFKKTIGVDAGSQNIRLAIESNIIFNERSQISLDKVSERITGIGNDIVSDKNSKILKPINHVIADFQGTEYLLRGALNKSDGSVAWFPSSYKMYFSIPTSISEVDKRAYRDVAEHAGGFEVHFVHSSTSAALGMGILFSVKDFILVDISASGIEITPFSNSKPVGSFCSRVGIWKIKRVIKNHFLRSYQLILSDEELDQILSFLNSNDAAIKIQHGVIPKQEINELLSIYYRYIQDEILEVFESIQEHTNRVKIMANGMYFTGGGSNYSWLINKICFGNKMSHQISKTPLIDNINGIIRVMADPNGFQDYLMV